MLDQIHAFVLAHQEGSLIAISSFAVEALMRLLPTKNPLSVLHAVAVVAHKVADIIAGIANILDKVLPQNTK